MKEIVFTKDFATKKSGEVWKCDSQLASQLVNGDKVAKYVVEKANSKKTEEVSETEKVKKEKSENKKGAK
jgi:DNA-directed RNA polymerase subunit M/transcription elongation factor TFIIS